MRTSRTLAATLLVAALLAVPLGAAGAKVRSSPPKAKPGPASLLSRAWSVALAVWEKAGCAMDPHGGCVTAPAPVNSLDAGCEADPNGRCHS